MSIARWSILLSILALLICAALSAAAEEILFYRLEGAFSNYNYAQVTIDSSGKAEVVYQCSSEAEKKATFNLNDSEMAACRLAIKASGLMTSNAKDSGPVIDGGITTVRVTQDGKTFKVKAGIIEGVRPVSDFAWLLINQASIIEKLETEGAIYNALVSVDNDLLGAKILQPRSLIEPIKAYVLKGGERVNLPTAFEALAQVTPPQEWLGFVTEQFAKLKGKERGGLFRQLVYSTNLSNIGKAHAKALNNLFLTVLREDYPRWEQLTQLEQSSVDEAASIIVKEYYNPWEDFRSELINLNPRHALLVIVDGKYFVRYPGMIDKFGEFLKSANRDLRLSALYHLREMYEVKAGEKYYDYTFTQADIERARKFAEPTIPAVRKIAADESDGEIQRSAQSTLKIIDQIK